MFMDFCFWKKRSKLSDMIGNKLPIDVLKKRTRIAVIDDEESSLPIESLREDGFAIDYFPCIDATILKRLLAGDFDVIVLDIKGVVSPQIIQQDGLGMLQYLKEKNPTQLIVACSSKKFDPSKHKFFSLANDVLDKPITFVDCKERLEQIITENLTISNRWVALEKYLSGLGWETKKIDALEKEINRSLKNPNKFSEKVLAHLDKHAPAYTLILQAIQQIFKFGGQG